MKTLCGILKVRWFRLGQARMGKLRLQLPGTSPKKLFWLASFRSLSMNPSAPGLRLQGKSVNACFPWGRVIQPIQIHGNRFRDAMEGSASCDCQ